MSKICTKQDYIKALDFVLRARDDFKGLAYHKHPSTGEEYLFMSVITGEVFMFNVTGYSEYMIFNCIAQADVNGLKECDNLITDLDKRIELGKLFN